MKNQYFGDNRDLIKWAVLFHLAKARKIKRIYQIAYYRETSWPKVEVDNYKFAIPKEVLAYFRNIYNIRSISSDRIDIVVLGDKFSYRDLYQKRVIECVKSAKSRSIIFLDPDTGLEPQSGFKPEHVTENEVRQIWEAMPNGFILVLYQHKTNMAGMEWIRPKLQQLADCIKLDPSEIKIGRCNKLANDVVFFIVMK